jgi:hypothetical protein
MPLQWSDADAPIGASAAWACENKPVLRGMLNILSESEH